MGGGAVAHLAPPLGYASGGSANSLNYTGACDMQTAKYKHCRLH